MGKKFFTMLIATKPKSQSLPLLCRLLGLMLLSWVWGSAMALVPVADLYSATAVVPDRSDAALRLGAKQALSEVLVRVSGNPGAIKAPGIRKVLKAPEPYVAQYGFRRRQSADQSAAGFDLTLSFNERAVKQLLRSAGLLVWSAQRPETLVWLAMTTTTGERQLVTPDNDPQLAAALVAAANQRGLPLAFPLDDLIDQQSLSMGDIWGLFLEPVKQASMRYDTEAVLVGRISGGGKGYQAKWVFLQGNHKKSLQAKAAQRELLFNVVMDSLAKQLSARFGVSLSQSDSEFIWLHVRGLNDLADIASLQNYLQSLTTIEQFFLDKSWQDRARFKIYAEAGVEALKKQLAASRRLFAESAAENASPPQRFADRPMTAGAGTQAGAAEAEANAAKPAKQAEPDRASLHYRWQ